MPGLVHRSGCVFHFFHVRGVSQVKLKLKELVSKKLAVGRKVRLWYKRVRRTNVGEGQIYKKKKPAFSVGESAPHTQETISGKVRFRSQKHVLTLAAKHRRCACACALICFAMGSRPLRAHARVRGSAPEPAFPAVPPRPRSE